MRVALLALVLGAAFTPLSGQQTQRSRAQSARPATQQATAESASTSNQTAAAVRPAQREVSREAADSLRKLINRVRQDPEGAKLPPTPDITLGGTSVAAGAQVAGPVATAGGNLDVYGTITGDAIAIDGDVVVHPGGRVTGDAVAAYGRVRQAGGVIEGEMRALGGAVGTVPPPAAAEDTAAGATRRALALSATWLVIMVLIGIGVLVFAGNYLDGVVDALEGRFAKSFWAGLLTQLALAPALLLLVVALALTVIGLLLIPFAIVAFVLATAGLVTLGFLAVARVTGESVAPGATRRLSSRGAALRAVVLGVAIYMGLWVVAAAFAWAPMLETVLRGVAVAITWVAATVGLGAAVVSRGGMRREAEPVMAPAPVNDLPWQTPTPVTGVVAARRPTPVSSGKGR